MNGPGVVLSLPGASIMKLAVRLLLGSLLVAGIFQWGGTAEGQPRTEKVPTGYLNSELPRWLKVSLFPSSHDKFGLTDLFCWSNLEHLRGGLQYAARANLALGFADNFFWLANRQDGIYSGGKILVASSGSKGSFIGHEPDAQARWNITSRTQVDFTAWHIFAGTYLHGNRLYDGFNVTTFGIEQRL
jgi:Alginate export